MLDKHFTNVPEYKGHRTSGLGDCLLCVIPSISITIDTATTFSSNVNTISCKDDSGGMILKCNRVGIISPVCEIIR